MVKEKKGMPYKSFRIPEITDQHLDYLSKKWGENKSAVIRRLISMAYVKEADKDNK